MTRDTRAALTFVAATVLLLGIVGPALAGGPW